MMGLDDLIGEGKTLGLIRAAEGMTCVSGPGSAPTRAIGSNRQSAMR